MTSSGRVVFPGMEETGWMRETARKGEVHVSRASRRVQFSKYELARPATEIGWDKFETVRTEQGE